MERRQKHYTSLQDIMAQLDRPLPLARASRMARIVASIAVQGEEDHPRTRVAKECLEAMEGLTLLKTLAMAYALNECGISLLGQVQELEESEIPGWDVIKARLEGPGRDDHLEKLLQEIDESTDKLRLSGRSEVVEDRANSEKMLAAKGAR